MLGDIWEPCSAGIGPVLAVHKASTLAPVLLWRLDFVWLVGSLVQQWLWGKIYPYVVKSPYMSISTSTQADLMQVAMKN